MPGDYQKQMVQQFIQFVKTYNPKAKTTKKARRVLINRVCAQFSRARKKIDPRLKCRFSMACIYRALAKWHGCSERTIRFYVRGK